MGLFSQFGARAGGDIVGRDKINADPTLANERIAEELKLLRERRWFAEYDQVGGARRLASRCLRGDLVGGSEEPRGEALAWCARLLTGEDDLSEAESLLAEAKNIVGEAGHVKIAESFIISKREDVGSVLSVLAGVGTSQAKTAALIIMSLQGGEGQALEWYGQSGLKPEELDDEGRGFILNAQLRNERWDDAFAFSEACEGESANMHPLVIMNLAFVDLMRIVPIEFRQIAFNQNILNFKNFELASNGVALRLHKKSYKLFSQAAATFNELDLPKISEAYSNYALWLGLRHPEMRVESKEQLRERLKDSNKVIKLLPLALSFEESLDVDEIEKELVNETVRHGGATVDVAVARLSIALSQRNAEDVAQYIDRYREDLLGHIHRLAVASIEIEALCKCGRLGSAEEVLKRVSEEESISAEEQEGLQQIINDHRENDRVSVFKKRYEESESLADLKNLMCEIRHKKDWEQLCLYSEIMFSITKSTSSLEDLASSLISAKYPDRCVKVIEENEKYLSQSDRLCVLYTWALYQNGQILKAKNALSRVPHSERHDRYALRRNIAIAIGDWNDISKIVVDELDVLNLRSARQLLQAAYLGFQIGASDAARKLLFAAANKGEDDPHIQASAYFLATNAGIEENEDVSRWLHRAVELSGDEGPMYQASIDEVLERVPKWRRHENEVSERVKGGDLPLFLAAAAINSSLIQMMLLPFLYNQYADDPRRKIAIPAFSGRRGVVNCDFIKSIWIDPSALLTFGACGLLGVLDDCGCAIKIPHSTMLWLYEERQSASFQQPSRIKRARELQDLINSGKISVVVPTSAPIASLETEVGDELASLIGQADAENRMTEEQHIVIRSAPIYRPSSILKDQADLSEYPDVVVSCQKLVEKLVERGRVTETKKIKALAYLALNEKRWSTEIEIHDRSVIYLDELSVTYMQTCDLLEVISDAGFKVFVSESCVEDMRRLLAYQRISEKMDIVVEDIRTFINSGVLRGKIEFGQSMLRDDLPDKAVQNHPTMETLSKSYGCDAIIVDDRSINQHAVIQFENKVNCPLVTSVEFLSYLKSCGAIENNVYRDFMVSIRNGGYVLCGFDVDELYEELSNCVIKSGSVVETAELRAIRENLQLLRSTSFLKGLDESAWLDRIIKCLIFVLRRTWCEEDDINIIEARSDWMLSHIDLRGWLHCFPLEQAVHIFHEGRACLMPALLSAPVGISDELRDKYLQWVNRRIILNIKHESPKLFDAIVKQLKSVTIAMLDPRMLDDVDVSN